MLRCRPKIQDIQNIPNEIMIEIFEFSEINEFKTLRLANKNFKSITDMTYVWFPIGLRLIRDRKDFTRVRKLYISSESRVKTFENLLKKELYGVYVTKFPRESDKVNIFMKVINHAKRVYFNIRNTPLTEKSRNYHELKNFKINSEIVINSSNDILKLRKFMACETLVINFNHRLDRMQSYSILDIATCKNYCFYNYYAYGINTVIQRCAIDNRFVACFIFSDPDLSYTAIALIWEVRMMPVSTNGDCAMFHNTKYPTIYVRVDNHRILDKITTFAKIYKDAFVDQNQQSLYKLCLKVKLRRYDIMMKRDFVERVIKDGCINDSDINDTNV